MHSANQRRFLNLTWRHLMAVVICQFVAAAGLYAQISNASINGTARDSKGAFVPETAVLLRNTATGVETRTVTHDQGIYVILNILPGNYTLEASKAGFRRLRYSLPTLILAPHRDTAEGLCA